MAEESTRTKMIRETQVDDDMPMVKKAVRAVTLGASRLADKMGLTQEQEYKDKTKEELMQKSAPEKKAKGGVVGSASKRADGCAIRGKTKGRMV
jgi:hypothetical protein